MAVYGEEEEGKHAVTHYNVIERFGYVSLVECTLESQHQIRVHFKFIGHPLFNDPEYGETNFKGIKTSKYQKFILNNFNLLKGQALHAKTLGFEHPAVKK